MAQVVTNENMLDFIQNRQVPEFKAPEAKAEAATTEKAPAVAIATTGTAIADKGEPARGPDGKFVKTDAQPAKVEDTAAKAAESDDDEDPALTEKIRKLIAKKHRAMKEAEEFGRDEARRAIAAESRAEALQKQIDDLKGTKSGTGPAPAEGKPKPEDFKTVGEYTDALVEWKFSQRVKAQEAEDAKKQTNQKIEAATNQLGERIAEFAKTTPDYAEVMESCDLDVPPHVQAYFIDSENPGGLGYYFAKHPEEFDRIAKLSPIRALAELGKLEDKLFGKKPEAPAEKPAPAAPAQVSRAPAPIQPLEGKTTPVVKDPAQMSFQELRAYRNQQRAEGKWRA